MRPHDHEHDHGPQGHSHDTFPLDNDNYEPEEDAVVWRSLRRKFESLGLVKKGPITLATRPDPGMRDLGQPYTKVLRVGLPDVQAQPSGVPTIGTAYVYQVWGYTPELQFVNEDFEAHWEQHDLGQASTLKIAHETAAGWREGLVGEYDIK